MENERDCKREKGKRIYDRGDREDRGKKKGIVRERKGKGSMKGGAGKIEGK